ncbi:MAG: sigma-54-dependent Fis family transcriptional regulator [Oligoflexia bacterium]|nr:sigma-54-dependent Fis family transcriptional regulator [Oligoflexia bacterium]
MKILIVEDDILLQQTLKSVFKDYHCTVVTSFSAAEEALSKNNYIAAFLDIQLEGPEDKDGILLLKKIQSLDPYLPCVMISGIDNPQTIAQCLEIGAVDYVAKGTVNPQGYQIALLKALHWRNLKAQTRQVTIKSDLGSGLKGVSEKIKELKGQINSVGKMPGPFLILGETGTGKELIAKALWENMGKNHRPFITVNCASLPENLVESELFGYEKGAFTGALNTKTGLFEAANGGDIFLDEIGDLNPELQAKLLRVLQEKKVRRLGSEKERPIDFRVIAATNVNLNEAIEKKEFREDLFFRLNVFTIKASPLRERKEDIAYLLQGFLNEFKIKSAQIESKCLEVLTHYSWPGNVRQLKAFALFLVPKLNHKNLVLLEYFNQWLEFQGAAKELSQNKESASDNIQGEVKEALSNQKSINIVEKMQALQKNYVLTTLKETKNNRSTAARLLGVSRQRLSNWLTEWGIFND